MTISLDFAELAPLITDKTLILTPNARTQKAIYTGYLSRFSEKQVVESIDVRSFSQWQSDLWSELSFFTVLPKRLSNLSIKSWLEKQVKNESAWTLTNPSGVANKILEAYQNLVQWNLCLDDVVDYDSIEIDYFKKWIKSLQDFCNNRNLIANFTTLELLLTHIAELKVCLPTHVLLVGFNQLTPLEQRFFDCLENNNCPGNNNGLEYDKLKVTRYDYKSQPEKSHQVSFLSLQDELNFAACFAASYAAANKNKNVSIGIVVNQLSNHLGDVHQAFSRVFQPEENKPWIALTKPKYNVSAGFALSEQALVKAALLLLNLKTNQIKLEEIHFLKNTPYIDWGEQKSSTQYFLHQLCLNARKYYSISFLQKHITEQDRPLELSLLNNCLTKLSQRNNNHLPIEQHIEHWHAILIEWNWAVSGLNEFEIQAKNMFQQTMNESRVLNDLYDKHSVKDSLDFLSQSTLQLAFQIASDRSNVHVLGILEASGLQFDHLLVVGFNHSNWPQTNKINPFIPLLLQREKNMPGNSAEREYEYAKDLSSSLLSSAKDIIVTSSDNDANGAGNSNHVASFFSHLPICDVGEFVEESFDEMPLADYQWVEDSNIDLSKVNIRGGAYLLSDYAKCPFKSIAKHQLKLSTYQTPEIGVEPKTKGIWLHETMEIIWQVLKSQQSLLQMEQQTLDELVFDSLNTAMQKHHSYLLATTVAEVIELELNKLTGLILEWLSIETNRDEFWVMQLEQSFELDLGDLNLKFRVDRIDRNKDNQIEIIDYKTGKTEISSWFGVRPTEAQMPAYVLATRDNSLSGINYARIKTGEVAQTGLSFKIDEQQIIKSNHCLSEKKDEPLKQIGIHSLEDLVMQWQKSLSRMASGIAKGYMPVSPKDKNLSCLYCEYKAVCRIDEIQPNE